MLTKRKAAALLVPLLVALAPHPASAVLERVGPNSPANFLPEWYQDTTGLTLEFCSPATQQELVDGYCLILPADVPGGLAPEVFPNVFSGEHFYWASDVTGDYTYTIPNSTTTLTGRVVFVQALEAAFLGDIGPGLGGVFGRVRIRVDSLPLTGIYTFYMPWGVKQIAGIAGDRIFDSEDIGVNCAAFVYDCALQSSIGPFLVPSDSPGGAELAPVVGPSGALFLSDPARVGPVTGSPIQGSYTIGGQQVNPNVFAVVAPDGQVIFKSHAFTTMGRIHTAVIPSRVISKRASYARDVAGSLRLDAYATGEPTIAPRLPAAPPSTPTQPDLRLYAAPCAGTIGPGGDVLPPFSAPVGQAPVPMARNGNLYWAFTLPPAIPAGVCVEDANARTAQGVIQPSYTPGAVSDQVFVTAAVYDPSNGGSLSVRASSSDQFAPPLLALGAFGDLATNVTLVDDLAFVTPVSAPPSLVRVTSQEGGAAELLVKVGTRAATGVTLTADRASPQFPGIAVTFTAQGAGATEYLYRFWLNDGTAWSVVRDWSASSVWVLPATTPTGSYQVKVDVWSGLSPTAPDATSQVLPMTITTPPATGVTLTASLPSPQVQGTAVTFTATGQGSSGYSYRFHLSSDGGLSYAQVQDWSPTATWTMLSTQPIGSYRVLAEVRTSTLVARDAYASLNMSIVAPPATGVTLAVDPAMPSPHVMVPGQPVLFTAQGQGPAGSTFYYRYYTNNGAGYVLQQDWSTTSTWSMPDTTPAGNYTVLVEVRAAATGPRDTYKTLAYTVKNAPATGVTLAVDPAMPSPHVMVPGQPVLFTAQGQGPAGSTFYYRYYTNNGAGYVLQQDWGTSSTWSMPDTTAPATYSVLVEVRSNTFGSRDAYVVVSYRVVP